MAAIPFCSNKFEDEIAPLLESITTKTIVCQTAAAAADNGIKARLETRDVTAHLAEVVTRGLLLTVRLADY